MTSRRRRLRTADELYGAANPNPSPRPSPPGVNLVITQVVEYHLTDADVVGLLQRAGFHVPDDATVEYDASCGRSKVDHSRQVVVSWVGVRG